MTSALHKCDSLQKMSELIAEGWRADLIVTDPPYKLTSGGSAQGQMGGCFDKKNYHNDGSIVHCDIDWGDFMPLLYRILAAMPDNWLQNQ